MPKPLDENLLNRLHEAWRRGILSWKFHAGQETIDKEFNRIEGKLFVANCSRRFGKTYWACAKCVEKAIQVRNAQVFYASAYVKDLRKFALPMFRKLLEDCPEELMPEWRSVDQCWNFHNGSQIHLIGLDRNPDGVRGNYCDLAVFEEAGLISRLSYLYSSVVIPMTLYRDGAKVIMISTPPETPAHEFQEFCERARLQGGYSKLTIYDNPLLTAEMIAEIKEECFVEEDWLREYMCEFIVDANRAIVREWQPAFEVNPPKPDNYEYLHKYVAMDIGVRDLTACVFGYYDAPKGAFVVEAECDISGADMTTEKIADAVRQTEWRLWAGNCECAECKPALEEDPRGVPPSIPPAVSAHKRGGAVETEQDPKIITKKPHRLYPVYRRIADNNAPLLLQDLGHLHGLHFNPTGKDDLHAMVNELRYFISQGRLLINPACVKTLGSIKYGIWDKQKKAFARSRVYGHFDHLAAVMYLVRNLDQHSDPVPKGIGLTRDNHHFSLQIGQVKSAAVDAVKKMFRFNK